MSTIVPPTPNTQDDNAQRIRWKVACINWGHLDAPHAMTYRLRNGEMQAERYWPTWAEAVAYVQDACTRPLWSDMFGIAPGFELGGDA